MAPPRASWKGFLTIAEVTLPVALYAAASSSERIVLHTVNRATGNRVQRQYVDAETGAPVEREDQVKGYEVGKDQYVMLDPEEIAAATPVSDKRLTVSAFVGCDEVDDVYLDRPYYLAPSDRSGEAAFQLIREGLARLGDGGDRRGGAVPPGADASDPGSRRGASPRPRSTSTTRCARPARRSPTFRRSRSSAKCWISPSISSRPSRPSSTRRASATVTRRRSPNSSRRSSRAGRSPRRSR